MRCFVSFTESSAVLLVILTATVFGQGHSFRIAGKCGKPVAGIALCLSRSAAPDGATLEVRNTGPEDAVLNLGIMEWTRQYATALPFVVPLPSGASLKLPLHISKCIWYASGQLEDFEPDPKKRYTLQAQFMGKGVSQADPDFKGLTLMPYWKGTVVSNAVAIGPK